MATALTAGDLIAAFKKRGVKYRFYKDYEDFKTHNRNKAGANASATPGGFGPIEGVTWHNYGSSGKDIDQLAYLYRGDGPTSGKPGPLCLGGITDDGTVVLMGWGTATHAGPGDPKVRKLAQANKMPQDGEIKPTTNGTMPGTVPVNPFYLGFEMCHGPEGPTAACLASLILATAAIMEMLGGIEKGYSGGSVVMHREWTTNRSDPQGVPKDGKARAKVTALLKQWAAAEKPPAPTEPTGPTNPPPTGGTVTLTTNDAKVVWGADIIDAPVKDDSNPYWTPASYLIWTYRNLATTTKKVDDLTKKVDDLTATVGEMSKAIAALKQTS